MTPIKAHNLRFAERLNVILESHYADPKNLLLAIGKDPSRCSGELGKWRRGGRVPRVGVYLALCQALPGEAGRLMRSLVECGGASCPLLGRAAIDHALGRTG